MKRKGLLFLGMSFFWLIIAAIDFVMMVQLQEGSIWAYAVIPLALFCSLTNYKRFLDCRDKRK